MAHRRDDLPASRTLDGSGYPRGLKGDEIIMEARILGVADVVESIYSFRPYRPSRGPEAAREELLDGRGVRYDSLVVDICERLIFTKGFDLKPRRGSAIAGKNRFFHENHRFGHRKQNQIRHSLCHLLSRPEGQHRRWHMVSRGDQPKCITGNTQRPDAAIIVPYHRKEKKLVVIKEFRIPVGGYQYGFPAGLLDPGEDLTLRRQGAL